MKQDIFQQDQKVGIKIETKIETCCVAVAGLALLAFANRLSGEAARTNVKTALGLRR